MQAKPVSKIVIHRSAVRSTKESANLEGRTVPPTFTRSERIEAFLAERRKHISWR